MKKTPNFKGYNPLFSAKNDAASTLADAHEGFELGWEALEDEGGAGAPASGAMKGANVWPDERAAPEFRGNVLRY
jgi:isopenicillin N synthase-like dioxygenase